MAYNKTKVCKNRGTRTGKVEFIVLHDTAGSGTPSDVDYLAHDPENRGVSVDFVVTKDGTAWQLNNDLSGHCTYHAGRHTAHKGRFNGGVNQHSIGIEISQKSNMEGLNPAYPDTQVKMVAQVCRDLCERFNLDPHKDITTHKDIITDKSRTDPRNFPWPQFWAYVDDGEEAQPVTDPEGKIFHTVVAGDTLFGLANKYHTNIEHIKALNNMETPSTMISVGQVLQVG